MIRTAGLIVAGAALISPAAAAETAAADADDGRYSFSRAEDGYLRLDGRTGQVSMCTRRAVGWACQLLPDERTTLETEIARLQGENVALKKELIARNVPLPGTVKPEPPPAAKPEEPQLQLPGDANLNKVVSFVEKVWRRLVEAITTLQKDVLKGT
ncbi:MAG TPA: hypothetical protein VGF60_04425 [Xanthobacteraceae bacterium]|jgi:hypothetical protein